MTPSRRDFLKGAVGGAGALLVGKVALGEGSVKPAVNIGPISAPSAPAVAGSSGIDHVVVVMMENRSFDHFLGWMPNANGTGLNPDGSVRDAERFAMFQAYPDADGKAYPIWHTEQLNGPEGAPEGAPPAGAGAVLRRIVRLSRRLQLA